MRFLILLIAFQSLGKIRAQVLSYAREVVETLASEEFKGRGYVQNGDRLAANFIADEFRRFGLKSFGENYFQRFEISVNTFPNDIRLSIGDYELEEGKDYLVTPGSPSLTGSFETVYLEPWQILDEKELIDVFRSVSGKILVVGNTDHADYTPQQENRLQQVELFLKYHPGNPAVATIFLADLKVSWNGSQAQHPKASFTVYEDSIKASSLDPVVVEVKAELKEKYETQNVIGYLEGNKSDSIIVLMAHYDHFGKMGSALFPGANDNASGTAMMLSLARHFSENPPAYTTVFIAFGAEEIGLIGSKYFVENPLFDLSTVKFLLNFDLAGTGDEGIQVVNGSVYRDKFEELKAINEDLALLPKVKIRGAACNSDHCPFDEAGVPGFYIYTLGGIRAYHDVYDRYETLPFTEFEDYFRLVTRFLEKF